MGLFDKIKDNAKTISMKALEATREYDEDYQPAQSAGSTVQPTASGNQAVEAETVYEQPQIEVTETELEFEAEPAPKEPAVEEPAAEKTEDKKEGKDEKDEKPRKSKVVEISKEEHEKAEKEKRQEKAKQAAKERLAKSYVPSYKKSQTTEKTEDKKEGKDEKDEKEAKPETKKPAAPKTTIGIVDVKPGKIMDPVKRAIYARERAALNALASQRKLNGTVPLYIASHMNFRTKVYINRIEYSGSFGKSVLPIEQVAWIKVRNGGTGVIIETTEGKRVVMVVKQADRLAFVDAVMKVQALQPKKGKFKDTQTVRIDKLEQFGEGIDEIEKLAKLYDKGILSQEEFELKKKQILGL